MDKDMFGAAQEVLAQRPQKLTDRKMWLFVAVNTARALIAAVSKDELSKDRFTDCGCVSELQYNFDMIQGIYGRRFSSKKNPVYNYLCSLVAFFPDGDLSDDDRRLITEYNSEDRYLLYEMR